MDELRVTSEGKSYQLWVCGTDKATAAHFVLSSGLKYPGIFAVHTYYKEKDTEKAVTTLNNSKLEDVVMIQEEGKGLSIRKYVSSNGRL